VFLEGGEFQRRNAERLRKVTLFSLVQCPVNAMGKNNLLSSRLQLIKLKKGESIVFAKKARFSLEARSPELKIENAIF
jgi:hypothetical protein